MHVVGFQVDVHSTNGIIQLTAPFLEIHILCTQLPNFITENADIIPKVKHFGVKSVKRPG